MAQPLLLYKTLNLGTGMSGQTRTKVTYNYPYIFDVKVNEDEHAWEFGTLLHNGEKHEKRYDGKYPYYTFRVDRDKHILAAGYFYAPYIPLYTTVSISTEPQVGVSAYARKTKTP